MNIISWEKMETIYIVVEDENGNQFNVTWNKDTHNEGQNSNYLIPEYEVTNEDNEFISGDEFDKIIDIVKQDKILN